MTSIRQGLPMEDARRQLASIQEVKEIRSIEDADKIELAVVNGWQVVVKKGEFKPGDLGVYFEIDSFLPEVDEYSFVGKVRTNPITAFTEDPQRGFRLSTSRFRGALSQGLMISLSKLANTSTLSDKAFKKTMKEKSVGDNVTELLGVKKWEKSETTSDLGVSHKGFPSAFTSKTDEVRAQNNPEEMIQLRGRPFFGSAKYDGTSSTIVKDGDELIWASRSNSFRPNSLFEQVATAQGIKGRLQEYDGDIVIQSEMYGEGIQGNLLGIKGKRLATFNIEIDGVRLGLLRMLDVVDELGLDIPEIVLLGSEDTKFIDEVKSKIKFINKSRKRDDLSKFGADEVGPQPIVLREEGISDKGFDLNLDEMLTLADSMKYRSGRIQEGIVFRTVMDCDAWDPISFKVVSNKWLMKYDS